jgi:c-di-GMP-binding flagellar brake protein YcgR
LEQQNRVGTWRQGGFVESRRHPRFDLDVEIKIYSRTAGLLSGRTGEISEGGISAMLKIEVPLDEVVQLEFKVPLGLVMHRALVRHRNAFRYGFQFLESDPGMHELIKRTCSTLALSAPVFFKK